MKKLNLLLVLFAFIFTSKIFAQGMMPPAPIDSPLLKSMEGTWVSDPYTFMGSTMTDEVTQKMVLNGQFLQIDVRSIASNGFTYEALIMIAPNSDGTLEGWSYDIFGKKSITNYTGTWQGNTVYVYGKSSWGTESRNIAMEGNVMLQNVIFKMKDANGKDMPDQTLAITYNKK